VARAKALDANAICSYNVPVDGNRFSTGSILEFVDQNATGLLLEEAPKPASCLPKAKAEPR